MTSRRDEQVGQLKFRDPAQARRLTEALAERFAALNHSELWIMHVCGSHEQAIARFGLRAVLPAGLRVVMGPGCPVCVTDMPEVDEAVVLARQGVHIATFGDMLRVPGTVCSLADAQAEGARVHVVYGAVEAVDLARCTAGEVVFFATGFETTAVATAAVLRGALPANFSVLSAHKYVPPAMEIVARVPGTRVAGFLAAGHAATITGWGIFEPFAARHGLPVVVAGFEPLDILAGLVRLIELIGAGEATVANMYPRCVTREGNRAAQAQLWEVFRTTGGQWRGIADIPDGNLRLREAYADVDARRRFTIDLASLSDTPMPALAKDCICGRIMTGLATPVECALFGRECLPETPIGACMVSSEGTCRIWHHYGGGPA